MNSLVSDAMGVEQEGELSDKGADGSEETKVSYGLFSVLRGDVAVRNDKDKFRFGDRGDTDADDERSTFCSVQVWKKRKW